MSLVLYDRVRETTIVLGTSDAVLLGAVTGFQSFATVGNGNTCYYTIADNAGNWEVGLGTYSTVGPTLARTTVYASSNSNVKVSFPAGTKDIFLTYPAEKAVQLDAAGNLSNVAMTGASINSTPIGASSASTGVFTQLNVIGQGDLRLEDTTGGEYVALQAPSVLASSYTLTLPIDDGVSGQALITDGNGNLSWFTAASGDVYGPASATSTAVALFDGTTGKLIKNSGVTIDGSNNVSGVAQLNATTVDLTNLEVTNIKAKDGTQAIAIADSTGALTINSGTANGVAYLNGSKVLTTGSALTFDGSSLVQKGAAGAPSAIKLFNNNQSSSGFWLGQGWSSGTDNIAYLLNTANADFVFATNNSEKMRLTSTGLGIGTSSPGEKLQVTATTAQAGIKINNNNATTFVGAAYASGDYATGAVAGDMVLRSASRIALSANGGSSVQAVLDNAGNLGLGVTPSTFSGLSAGRLEVGAIGNSLFSNGSTNFWLTTNTNYVSGTGYSYATTNVATMYLQSAGAHKWYAAPSGTAGNGITFTNVLAVEKAKTLALEGASSQSGTGITFPATQSASSDANTLDDYEEGTFTPTNAGGMSGFSAIDGTYIKVGRLVKVRGSFSITGVTTNMVMGGLPFGSMNQTFYSVVDYNIPVSLAYRRVDSGATTIQWNVNSTGSFSVTISFTAWYFTA